MKLITAIILIVTAITAQASDIVERANEADSSLITCFSVKDCKKAIVTIRGLQPELRQFVADGCPASKYSCLGVKMNTDFTEKRIEAKEEQFTWMAKQEAESAEIDARYAKEEAAEKAERDRLAKLPGVRVGMTASEVLTKTSWGKPSRVNRTTTSNGTREQWVYFGQNYLYFNNNILTAVQN